jgi:hypothetical protein
VDTSLTRLNADEVALVGAGTADPELRALEVAIFVEEVLDVVLPDEVLDARHMGTADAVARTVAGVTGGL